jgi:hypothetical protein
MTTHASNVRRLTVVRGGRAAARAKERERPPGKTVETLHAYLLSTSKRLRKHTARAKAYGFPPHLNVIESMTAAVNSLVAAVNGLERVPDDWRPLKGSVGWNVIEPGDTVMIRPRFRPQREDYVDTTKALKVTKMFGGKCSCVQGDTTIMIPKSQLERIGKDD